MQFIQIKFAFTILLHTILESQNSGPENFQKRSRPFFFRYFQFADFFKKEKK